jgi:hypothetical protein
MNTSGFSAETTPPDQSPRTKLPTQDDRSTKGKDAPDFEAGFGANKFVKARGPRGLAALALFLAAAVMMSTRFGESFIHAFKALFAGQP